MTKTSEVKQVWYATRQGLNATTDEDRAMAYQRLGPFDDRDEGYRWLCEYMRDGVLAALKAKRFSTPHLFGEQYLQLLWRLLQFPQTNEWVYESVRWSLGPVTVSGPSWSPDTNEAAQTYRSWCG